MVQSEALLELQRYQITQELCDEIDSAFALIKSQADDIKRLEYDVQIYRKLAGLT